MTEKEIELTGQVAYLEAFVRRQERRYAALKGRMEELERRNADLLEANNRMRLLAAQLAEIGREKEKA